MKLYKIINPNGSNKVQFVWFRKATQVEPGGSFGERALIKNEDRAATCICSNDSSFATLTRTDYNWIIGLAHRRELRTNVELLKNFRILSDVRNSSLEKIYYFMKRKKFKRAQHLFA